MVLTFYFTYVVCTKKQSESNDVAVCQECVSTSGLYLKIRILLRCGTSDDHIKAG